MKLEIYIALISSTFMLTSSETASAQHDRKDSVTITSIIQEKKSRGPVEQKIDSRLLYAVNNARKKQEPGPNDFSQVNADKAGNIEVDITAEVTDSLLARIKKLGGKIIFPSKQYRTLRAVIPLSSVKTIAGYREVRFIQPAAMAQTNAPNGNMTPGNSLPTERITPAHQP